MDARTAGKDRRRRVRMCASGSEKLTVGGDVPALSNRPRPSSGLAHCQLARARRPTHEAKQQRPISIDDPTPNPRHLCIEVEDSRGQLTSICFLSSSSSANVCFWCSSLARAATWSLLRLAT
jgi:hypothetical protein